MTECTTARQGAGRQRQLRSPPAQHEAGGTLPAESLDLSMPLNVQNTTNGDEHNIQKEKDVRGQEKFQVRDVRIENQLDEQTVKVKKPQVLCMPSTKTELP